MKRTILLFLLLFLCFAFAACALAGGFGVARDGGVSWLTLPGGPRFFSIGADTVNCGTEPVQADAYSFSACYADRDAWAADTEARLRSWGFNTRGGWSDPTTRMSLPLVPEIDLGRNSRLHWFDPFAPDALAKTVAKARELTEPHRNNPAVIGYFTDNEVGWWNAPLFRWYLGNEWAVYSKQFLWRMIFDHYRGRWDRLLADFVPGPDVHSFEDLKKGRAVLKLRPGGQGIHLIQKFTAACAGRYYELVHKALKAVDPDRLVMGDRLPLYYNQDAVLASRGHLDVLSTNYNVDTPDGWVAPYYFEGLAKLTDAPVLISEFFFAADENRSGNINNGHLMHVKTQAERAAGAAAAVRNFAAFPNVVGTHWFQYYDEPSGGRGDGENFNMGLVDIRNEPYEGLVAALTRANAAVPAIHVASAKAAPPLPAVVPVRPARGPVNATDDSLADWPDKAATRLPWFTVPAPHVPFGDVHVSWSPDSLNLFNLAQNYADLYLLDHDGPFPVSETYRINLDVDAGAGVRHFAACLVPRPHAKYPGRFELAPELYEVAADGSLVRLEEKGVLQVLDKPLPHIAVEMALPAKLFGVDRLTAGMPLRIGISVTTFYREMTMTLGQGPQGRTGRDGAKALPMAMVLSDT
ncbi:hypothetical protein DFW101_3273 [Solidesulfovibrio carbinoliphilus subsp. oakridgensis]|uniref:Glycoside hydrolase family 42 N-terminal domain-containing protein n=1 Tax=Solidesulfovibrio carbinoliphilus subsp. oakridgensis TaxID=694327 RepID=G7QAP1_9BACT|nr:hypothetical protein [Solidesulfovibrio carbinoliphilus]EHJ49272.1 hypothetical protein DFW101_3273 [Solidesulfovibrio carbinoliphilus subsp. oakridgensis]